MESTVTDQTAAERAQAEVDRFPTQQTVTLDKALVRELIDAVAAEREAIAELAEDVAIEYGRDGYPIEANGAFCVAARIRSRGEAQ